MLGNYWPRRVAPAAPLAAALLDHHRTGRPRHVRAHRTDGVSFTIETTEYFTLEGQLAELDALAIERCRGRVLDVGAGAGRHSLALQERGREVVAIDVSPTCSALCTERGVRDARVFDIMTLHSGESLGRFDSIFFGMQTIGVAGGLAPLEELLRRLKCCLVPGGELVVDSSDLREPWEGDRVDRTPTRGEIVLSTRYRGLRGNPFPWLYLAEEDLAHSARNAGYEMDLLARVEGGEYLAALRPCAEGSGA
jgi:SAM-dependent methyltransferase